MLSILLIFLSCFLCDSFHATQEYTRKRIYGMHNGAVFNISQHGEELLKNHLSVQETGEMLVYGSILNENEEEIGYFGTMDDSFRQLEQLSFVEGGYPQKEDEIAVEYAVLQILDVPYDVGKPLTLKLKDADGTIEEKTYVLSGVMDSYTADWQSDGYQLVSGVVCHEGDVSQRNLFFLADYENANQMQELSRLIHDRKDSWLVYNSYSYPEKFNDLSSVAENGGVVFPVFCICAVFLISVEIAGYRKQMYRNRVFLSLGISEKMLKHMVMRGAVIQWLFSWMISMAVCTVAGVFMMIGKIGDMRYHLTLFPYITSLILTLLIVIISKWMQSSIFRYIRFIPGGKDLTGYETGTGVRSHGNCVNQKSFASLQKKRLRKTFALEKVMIVMVMIVLVLCSASVSYEWAYTTNLFQDYPVDYRWESVDKGVGLNRKQITRISNTTGISEVYWYSRAMYDGISSQAIVMKYDGMENDPYVSAYRSQSYPDAEDQGMAVEIVSLPQDSPVWNDLPKDMKLSETDQFFCYFEPMRLTDQGAFFDYQAGNIRIGIHEGTEITIETAAKTVSLTCTACIEYPTRADMPFVSGTVFVRQELYESLFGTKGEILYNYVSAEGNSYCDFEVTDHIMSLISSQQKLDFTNERQYKNKWKGRVIQKTLFLSALMAGVLLLVSVLMFRNRISLYENEKSRWKLYGSLGWNRKEISLSYPDIRLSHLIIVLVMLNVLIDPFVILKQGNMISWFNGVHSTEYTLFLLKYQTQVPILFLPQVVCLVVFTVLLWMINRKKKKMMDEVNL
ncbi:MAG: hypothetical protein ACI32N_10725 [Bulleidia sp.]